MNATDKQRMHQDTLIVLIVTLLTYLVAGYFDLAERYIDWTAPVSYTHLTLPTNREV